MFPKINIKHFLFYSTAMKTNSYCSYDKQWP